MVFPSFMKSPAPRSSKGISPIMLELLKHNLTFLIIEDFSRQYLGTISQLLV